MGFVDISSTVLIIAIWLTNVLYEIIESQSNLEEDMSNLTHLP